MGVFDNDHRIGIVVRFDFARNRYHVYGHSSGANSDRQ